jgi:phage shock protein A
MIFGKLWQAVAAQFNKLANFFWGSDPISVMQYEYDQSVAQLRDGREGLERYRALVERVNNQVESNRAHVAQLEARTKAYLQAGDRDTAARFALELQKAKKELAENEGQLKMHEEAYNNNLLKIKNATGKLAQLREKIQKYDAELKMSRAEAEVAKLAQDFHFDVTTDFGQIEQVVQDRINQNRATARVAADLSSEGLEDIRHEQAAEKAMAEDALQQFEAQMGLRTPETTKASEEPEIGPAKKTLTKQG